MHEHGFALHTDGDPGEVAVALQRLETERAQLRALTAAGGLRNDLVALPAAKYRFVAAVAAAVDACVQVVAVERLRPPGGHAEAFQVLAERHRLSVGLADRLLDALGLRDRLVHGDPVVDDDFVAALDFWVSDLGRLHAELACPPDRAVA